MNPINRMRSNRQSRFASPFSERLAAISLVYPEAAKQLRDRLSPMFDHCHEINVRKDIDGVPVQGTIQGPLPSIKVSGESFYSPSDLSAWMLTWRIGQGDDQLRIKCDCLEHFQAVGHVIERTSRSSAWNLNWRSAILKGIQDFTEYDYPKDNEGFITEGNLDPLSIHKPDIDDKEASIAPSGRMIPV